ncbi:MAG: hypothetical protein LPJ98_02785, partial [Cyclobacteriaceae bacterium]|nr:hypothetical protein [Cyclobacteriaceae bacterium]
TIFLLKKDTVYGYPEAQKFNGIVTEHLIITSLQTDSIKEGYRYLENIFLSVFKNKSGETMLDIRLNTKDAWFYSNGKSILIDDLTEQGFSTVDTAYWEYNDVLVFTVDDYYFDRSNFVVKLYWSKSKGLIRYDKKNGEYWELVDEK